MIEQTKDPNGVVDLMRDEKRIFERFPSRFPVKFKDTRHGFGTDVYLCNASAGGVGIVTKERLYLNDGVALEVELLDGKGPMTIRGEVIWAHKKDTESWDIGLKFHKVVFMNLWRIYKFAETGSVG